MKKISWFPVNTPCEHFFLFFTLFFFLSIGPLRGSTEGGSGDETSCGIELPQWEDGDTHESFDVRLWPNAVLHWLEQENLRALIAHPETSERERSELKMILAMQRAWRNK